MALSVEGSIEIRELIWQLSPVLIIGGKTNYSAQDRIEATINLGRDSGDYNGLIKRQPSFALRPVVRDLFGLRLFASVVAVTRTTSIERKMF